MRNCHILQGAPALKFSNFLTYVLQLCTQLTTKINKQQFSPNLIELSLIPMWLTCLKHETLYKQHREFGWSQGFLQLQLSFNVLYCRRWIIWPTKLSVTVCRFTFLLVSRRFVSAITKTWAIASAGRYDNHIIQPSFFTYLYVMPARFQVKTLTNFH